MIDKKLVLDFYEKKSSISKFCLIDFLNLKQHESYIKISELLPFVLKKSSGIHIKSDNTVTLTPRTHFNYFLDDSSTLRRSDISFSLEIFAKKDFLKVITLKVSETNIKSTSFLELSEYHELVYQNNKIDKLLKELDSNINTLLSVIKKELNLFKEKKGKLFRKFEEMVFQKRSSELKIIEPLNKNFKDLNFLNNFLKSFQERIKFKNTNPDDTTFFINIGYENLYNEPFKNKKPDFNLEVVFFLIDEVSLRNHGDSKLLYLGTMSLDFNTYEKNFKLGLLDNINLLKNKSSIKKWGNSTLKNIIYDKFDETFK